MGVVGDESGIGHGVGFTWIVVQMGVNLVFVSRCCGGGSFCTEMVLDFNLLCRDAVVSAGSEFVDDKIGEGDIAVSVRVLNRELGSWVGGSCDGKTPMYPASVVKMFYLGYAAHLLDTGDLSSSAEFERACRDMIVDSNNDATGYVVDRVCGTTPGPELDETEFMEFRDKRGAVNRWFVSLGYQGVNAVNRTFNEGPYGREMQLLGSDCSNRNSLTTEACADFFCDVALGRNWTAERVEWMKGLMRRVIPADDVEMADAQARRFIGKVLPAGSTLYSKAGWTSEVRHDTAWLVLPDGREVVLVVFSKLGGLEGCVPFVASRVLSGLGVEVRDWKLE